MPSRIRSKSEDRNFFFILHNLPPNYSWTDLKDLVRDKTRNHKVGYSDVPARLPGDNSQITGRFWVKYDSDPVGLFHRLRAETIRGHSLIVVYWETTDEPPVLQNCNCQERGMAHCHYLPPKVRASPEYSPTLPAAYPNARSSYPAHSRHTSSTGARSATSYSPSTTRQTSISSLSSNLSTVRKTPPITTRPRYTVSRSGVPINTTHGYVATSSTGIHIRNLDYSTDAAKLLAHLSRHGCPPTALHLSTERGKNKGSATADLATPAGAQTAVYALNGSELGGKKLVVKLDGNRNPVQGAAAAAAGSGGRRSNRPVEARPPMVLDGSAGSREASS